MSKLSDFDINALLKSQKLRDSLVEFQYDGKYYGGDTHVNRSLLEVGDKVYFSHPWGTGYFEGVVIGLGLHCKIVFGLDYRQETLVNYERVLLILKKHFWKQKEPEPEPGHNHAKEVLGPETMDDVLRKLDEPDVTGLPVF